MKKGFTIIELLVVLAVIALLSGLSLTFFGSSSIKARDARRESDIKEIQKALGLYVTNIGTYPVCQTEVQINGTTDCLSLALVAERTMPAVPVDPRQGVGGGGCGTAGAFFYCYQSSSDGYTYTLRYDLEGNSIPGKSAGWQTVNP